MYFSHFLVLGGYLGIFLGLEVFQSLSGIWVFWSFFRFRGYKFGMVQCGAGVGLGPLIMLPPFLVTFNVLRVFW